MQTVTSRLCLLLAMMLLGPALVHAQDATAFMKKRQETVNTVLEKHKGEAAGDALSKQIDTLLDYEALSRHALSDHWDERSEADRKEFVSLLQQLVERSYRRNLRSTLGYKIDYVGEDKAKLGTVVRTEAKSRKNKRTPAVAIDYTLHETQSGWRVLDITTDGVSMVRNYRSQFNRILRKDGWDELIRRMKERLEHDGDAPI